MICRHLVPFLLFAITALALPLSSTTPTTLTTTDPIAPAFVANPPGRGTINVLLSCVITLGLCILTALHPDVVVNKTTLGCLIYKMTFMLDTLCAPEIVVSNSIHQWREAHRVHAAWLSLTQVEKGSKEDIGLEGAFFVVMGGCTVGGMKDGYTGILTPVGFLELTETGILAADILSRDAIIDKGDANTLAKLLVCVQAVWLAVQSAARRANGLPVTLLEYHVVIQVGYTMVIYFFMWRKPKDVNESIAVLQRNDFPSDKTFTGCVRVVAQSKRFIIDEYILNSLNGHTNALTAMMLGLPTCVLHLLAWDSHFPSSPEKWIWRISSIGAGCVPACMYLQFLISKRIVTYRWVSRADDPLYRRMHKLLMDKFPAVPGCHRTIRSCHEMALGEAAFYVTTLVTVVLAFGCSFLLSVVAFLSLRSVLEGSYETVVWANYWPHF